MEHKQHKTIKEQLAEHIAAYMTFTKPAGSSPQFVNPIEQVFINDQEGIEKAVHQLRSAWHLGYQSMPEMAALLEANGIQLIQLDAPFDFQGLSGWTTDQRAVIVINQHHDATHKTLLCLKELGHLLLKFPGNMSKLQINNICYRFAKAMLLPKAPLIMTLGRKRSKISNRELTVLSQKYGISRKNVLDRILDLGIISEYLHQQFCNWLEKTVQSSSQEIQTDVFKQLLYRAAVEEIIPMSRVNNLSVRRLREIKRPFVARCN